MLKIIFAHPEFLRPLLLLQPCRRPQGRCGKRWFFLMRALLAGVCMIVFAQWRSVPFRTLQVGPVVQKDFQVPIELFHTGPYNVFTEGNAVNLTFLSSCLEMKENGLRFNRRKTQFEIQNVWCVSMRGVSRSSTGQKSKKLIPLLYKRQHFESELSQSK